MQISLQSGQRGAKAQAGFWMSRRSGAKRML
jgi:hypothetical protein